MMQVWSNNVYQAPIHRVLAKVARDCNGLPFFFNPPKRRTAGTLLHFHPPWRLYRVETDVMDVKGWDGCLLVGA